MSPSQRVKSFIPSRLRQIVQPSWVRNYRWRKRFRREHPDVQVVQPADVDGCTFGRYIRIDKHAWVNNCVLGDHTYVADSAIVACCDIGKFCSIASRSHVGLAQHPSRGFVSTHPAFYRADPSAYLLYADRDYFPGFVRTTIGNDVWIGSAVQVRGGVTVGDGAIVGAGAVVTANVQPYSVMVGVPARHTRFRFDPDTIAFLERFKWWDRDENWLAANYKKFHDIDAFRAEFENQAP